MRRLVQRRLTGRPAVVVPSKGPGSERFGCADCVDGWAACEGEPGVEYDFLVRAGAIVGGVDDVGVVVEEDGVAPWGCGLLDWSLAEVCCCGNGGRELDGCEEEEEEHDGGWVFAKGILFFVWSFGGDED